MKLNDGIQSMATDLSLKTNNRRYLASRKLSYKELTNLYSDNWLVINYIDKTAQDMTRLDRKIETTLDENTLSTFERVEQRLRVHEVREEALQMCSLYGDSLVLAVTTFDSRETHATDYETELNLDEERITRFIVFDQAEYKPSGDIDNNVLSMNFGKPTFYLIKGDLKVHHSRVHHMMAKRNRGRGNKFNGVSDVQGVYSSLLTHDTNVAVISDLLEEAKVDVLKIEGFNKGVASNMESQYIGIARAMKSIKSSSNTLMIDKTAEYEQKQLAFSGLVEIWKQTNTELAGAMRRPLTKLFGQSASGFASGEEDNENYRDDIAALQESRLRALDEWIDMFIFDDLHIPSDTEFSFTYQPIKEESQATIAANLQMMAGAFTQMLQEGVITEPIAAKELKRLNMISSIDDEHIKGLEDFLNETKESQGQADPSQEPEAHYTQ